MWYKTMLLKDLPDIAAGTVLCWEDGAFSPFYQSKYSILKGDNTVSLPAGRFPTECTLIYPSGEEHVSTESFVIDELCRKILALYNNEQWTKTLIDIDRFHLVCPNCRYKHMIIGYGKYLMTPTHKDAVKFSKRESPTLAMAEVALCPHCGRWDFTGGYHTLSDNLIALKNNRHHKGFYQTEGISFEDMVEQLNLLLNGKQDKIFEQEMARMFAYYSVKSINADQGFNHSLSDEEYSLEGLVPPPTREEWLNSLVTEDFVVPPEDCGEPSPQEMYDARMDAFYGGWY